MKAGPDASRSAGTPLFSMHARTYVLLPELRIVSTNSQQPPPNSLLAEAVRLTELIGGPEITANNARFVAAPILVTVHIVSVTLYSPALKYLLDHLGAGKSRLDRARLAVGFVAVDTAIWRLRSSITGGQSRIES